ncbi:hypothetical protein PCASD_07790 [Puccinia coronata f. sp. avenae]|uniref:Structural maintenance of chromosomes protein 5 n=1 Tax=Puccinia coronata f. sp. avenae TaxID=200324 RepID=A0A2N5TAC0_9BASI|nr:hypothetical protein PCASD_11646 [Puccinia coronata f. sp. avenae]PLW40574.1 hypothetical protein PCASD_07790 [Puccinia coronata f. sp. avenae]
MSSKRKSHQIQSSDEEMSVENPSSAQRTTNGFGNNAHASDGELETSQPASQPHQSKSKSKSKSTKKRRTEDASPSLTVTRSSTKGKERAKTQRAETVDFSEEEDHANDLNGQNDPLPPKANRDSEGYIPGAIVHVALRNFVTYSSVDFSPGPYLNMIIGPNGTGKSTLVCAIVLGLGFSTGVLDRVSDIKSFIKHGAEEGSVEIELKGHPGEKNVTIKLNLILSSNSRVFELNGKRTPANQVQAIVKSFNIQADNLCCFLPQEKVSKFAEMKEPELLKETQKVAGHAKLYEWHEVLIGDGKEKLDLEAKLSHAQRSFKDVEKQVSSLQVEVDRYKERLEIENMVQGYELGLEQNKYLQQKLAHDMAKTELIDAKAVIENLEAENAPLSDQKKYFQRLTEQFESCQKKISSASNKCKSSLSKLEPEFKSTRQRLEDASEKVISLRDEERRHRDLKAKLQKEVSDLAKLIKDPVEEQDNAPFQEQLQALSARLRQITSEAENVGNRQKESYAERHRLIEREKEVQQQIHTLESVTGRKEADLNRYASNVSRALQRMRQFKAEGKFRGKAFEPVRLAISPKHQSYTQAVEACLNRDLLNTFIFTDPHDYELMADVCNDQDQLRVNLSCMRPGDCLSNYQPPMPLNALKKMGFDDYIINLINGPDEVLAHLCNQSRLHMTPIAHSSQARLDESKMQDRNFPIKSWIRGTTRFNISYSSYGAREMIIKSWQLSQPRILSIAGVDVGVVQQKKAELAEIVENTSRNEQAMSELKASDADLRQQHESLTQERKDVDDAWKKAKQPYVQYLKNVKNYNIKNAALEKEKAKPTMDQERATRKAALLQASKEHTAIIIKKKNIALQQSRLNTTLVTLNFRVFQHHTDQKAFETLFKAKNSDLMDAKAAYDDKEEHVSLLFKQAKDTILELRKTIESAAPEVRANLTELNTKLAQDRAEWKKDGLDEEECFQKEEEYLKQRLSEEQMALEGILPVDRSIMDRYQRYQAQMKQEQKELKTLESETDRCREKIKSTYDKWRPCLDKLIANIDAKFDAAFTRMGCLGHIVVVEDPDYDKWGIEVQVSFRDNEKLVRLDPHRQSGGERSLATIMYLMSLTELSKSPFSLVDEINQGMDRRAERRVHDQLVETTCRESASQYFLITPKLLFGLKYHPLMRVLCVNNGDWIPPAFKLGYWLDKAKAKRAQAH